MNAMDDLTSEQRALATLGGMVAQVAEDALKRPKFGGYRTDRSRVRVVVREPGQQRGQPRTFPGLPAEPATSTARSS
jgi:hypothetical protein